MKKDTHQTEKWAKDMKTFLYMGKTKFHRKRNMFTYRGKKLNFINNQGNLNETQSKTQYNSYPIDEYKRQLRPRVC